MERRKKASEEVFGVDKEQSKAASLKLINDATEEQLKAWCPLYTKDLIVKSLEIYDSFEDFKQW